MLLSFTLGSFRFPKTRSLLRKLVPRLSHIQLEQGGPPCMSPSSTTRSVPCRHLRNPVLGWRGRSTLTGECEIKSTSGGEKKNNFQQDEFNKVVGDSCLCEMKRFIHLCKHHRRDVVFQGLLHYVICKPWYRLRPSNECH